MTLRGEATLSPLTPPPGPHVRHKSCVFDETTPPNHINPRPGSCLVPYPASLKSQLHGLRGEFLVNPRLALLANGSDGSTIS